MLQLARISRPIGRAAHTAAAGLQRSATRQGCDAAIARSSRTSIAVCASSGPVAAASASFHRSSALASFTYPTSRTLDEIVKLPLLIPHTRAEVEEIWRAHHAAQQTLAADTMTAAENARFMERAKVAPLFVMPCFRLASRADSDPSDYDTLDTTSGFEMMLVNVQSSSLLLTSLEEYKRKGASDATPYAVITLYSDMASSKDLVLVRAEMMDVNVAVPQLMAIWVMLKSLYTAEDPSVFDRFARAFNKKPNPSFDFEAFIAYCTRIAKDIRLPRTKGELAANAEADNTPAAEFTEAPKADK